MYERFYKYLNQPLKYGVFTITQILAVCIFGVIGCTLGGMFMAVVFALIGLGTATYLDKNNRHGILFLRLRWHLPIFGKKRGILENMRFFM